MGAGRHWDATWPLMTVHGGGERNQGGPLTCLDGPLACRDGALACLDGPLATVDSQLSCHVDRVATGSSDPRHGF